MTAAYEPDPPLYPALRSRPEVEALADAASRPLVGFVGTNRVGDVVMLEAGHAQDLLILIASLCGPLHVGCDACGEFWACGTCGLGDQTDWCWNPVGFDGILCPSCKAGNCAACGDGRHP